MLAELPSKFLKGGNLERQARLKNNFIHGEATIGPNSIVMLVVISPRAERTRFGEEYHLISTGLPESIDSSIAHIVLVTSRPSFPLDIGSLSSITQSIKCLILWKANPINLP